MVWIHGGGFLHGSGNDTFFGPDYIVKHDVTLVTFNYRVGVLGKLYKFNNLFLIYFLYHLK
jgi:carboxylesterase type B